MRRYGAIMAAGLLLSSGLVSATAVPEVELGPEPVRDFHFFGRLDSWRVVDRDTLIVWATPFRPYLIELSYPSADLRFAQAIGVTSFAGTVSKHDTVRVRGQRYPIKAIYRLTREQARSWGKAT